MGEFPNPATQFTSGKVAVEMGRKGGMVLSTEKKLKAKLNGLKKRGLTDESAKELYEVMTDPNMDAFNIRKFLEEIKVKAMTSNEKVNLSKAMIDWHKAHYGEYHKVENLNLNINMTIDEWEKRLIGDDNRNEK